MNPDFRCIYCQKECKPIKGYEKDYSDGESYVMVYCKKHGLILFEKRYRGIFSSESYWEGRVAKTDDFQCKDCKHFNINKYSQEDDDEIQKACDLNMPLEANPSYDPQFEFRLGQAIACDKFKHKEIKK
jgi:hypothetical protein